MLRFPKGAEPRALVEARATPGSTWETLQGEAKLQVRADLARDQGWRCAYCQRRIQHAADRMKIEHWAPRAGGGEDLAWSNLLGCCLGDADLEAGVEPGTTPRKDRIHCDTSKGDRDLFLHPVEGQGPDPRASLRYPGSGQVTADDPRAKRDIEVLNLNAPRLLRARVQAVEALKSRLDKRGWSARQIRVEIAKLDERDAAGRGPELAEVARYHLARWERRRS
ncbi:MAG: retron system putative HNH endonuclease [Pseudomonadota bacterium]